MLFPDRLSAYMVQLDCKNKELADASGLSASIVSRYRSGLRTPQSSDTVERLASGLSVLAAKANITLSKEEVLHELKSALKTDEQPDISQKLSLLMETMDITAVALANALSYDSSAISRIRAGQRHPSDLAKFVSGVSAYALRRSDGQNRACLAALLGCQAEELEDKSAANQKLFDWLCSGLINTPDDSVSSFVARLDSFDLNEYIKSIHFNDIKVPTVPFTLPGSKSYYGIEQLRQSEIDFFKATALSSSREPVFMCSDMPMDDMSENQDFGKKWMFGIAVTLRKGLMLTIIHNLDRPFHELMRGLQAWIPMYMTGQVLPYYLPKPQNRIYQHLLYVSGAAALSGESIEGHHAYAKYYLTKNREEREYYRRRADALLKKARPLMDIYRSERKDAYRTFLEQELDTEGVRHGMLVAPPLWTIDDKLLERILKRNRIEEHIKQEIRELAAAERERMAKILAHSTVFDELHAMSREEFERYPVLLPLSDIFCGKDVVYSFEEYNEHIALTKKAADENNNYSASFAMSRAFRNIQIHIFEGKWAVVSKAKAPTVHFVIRHPQLRSALENMIPAVMED